MFEPLKIPGGQIHRIRGEDEPDAARTAAEAELRQRASRVILRASPCSIMIFLGLGEDGHVASLFPGEPAESSNDRQSIAQCRIRPSRHRTG